jgi:hypothetical protein
MDLAAKSTKAIIESGKLKTYLDPRIIRPSGTQPGIESRRRLLVLPDGCAEAVCGANG